MGQGSERGREHAAQEEKCVVYGEKGGCVRHRKGGGGCVCDTGREGEGGGVRVCAEQGRCVHVGVEKRQEKEGVCI